jgi:sugar O-acyltransferase (sialic acid O-acetyltransferase NeuD family)
MHLFTAPSVYPGGLVILGAAGHAKVVAEAARSAGWTIAGFLAPDSLPGTAVGSWGPVLGGDALIEDPAFRAGRAFAIGTGIQSLKRGLSQIVVDQGGVLVTVVHPTAIVCDDTSLGPGTFVAAGAIVATGVRVGAFAILNTGSIVDHDGMLADGSQVSPGVRLAGHVACGADAFIGTGAVVLPRVRIGAGAVVGAGAIVLADVPDGVTVVGIPAHPRR